MPVILLTNCYSKEKLNIVKNLIPSNFNFLSLSKPSKNDLIEKASTADYFLVSGRVPVDEDVLVVANKLKMIQRTGVGIDSLDMDTLRNRGIPVYVNLGINSASVAEHTLMLILSTLRQLPKLNSSVKEGKWLKQELGIQCNELKGKTVGLIGIGNIGLKVAKMLKVFSARVLYFDPMRLDLQEEKKLNITYLPFSDILKEVDILSLHCPLSSKTKGMIANNEISTLKPGSIIINTSRGGLIDEQALIEALKSGHLKGAGLDVFEKEPLSSNNPLLKMDNVILTPHVGGVTYEAFKKMIQEALQNIMLFEEGRIGVLEDKKLKI